MTILYKNVKCMVSTVRYFYHSLLRHEKINDRYSKLLELFLSVNDVYPSATNQ